VSDGAVYRYDAATGAYLGVFVEGGMFFPGLSGDILYVPRTPRPTPTATSTEQFTRTPTSTRTPTATPSPTATLDPALANHTIWVPNNFANEVLRYSAVNGALVNHIPTCGSPFDLAFSPDNYVLVACYYTGQIQRYDRNGNYLGILVTISSGQGVYPQFGPDEMLYVSIESQNRIERYTSAGTFVDVFTNVGLSGPSHLVFGTDGNLYVHNWNGGTGVVTRHNATTGQLTGSNPVVAGLSQLGDIDWRNGELLTLSVNGVERYNPATGERLGNFTTGGPNLSMPRGMEFGLDTRLYVMDAGNGSIYRYKASGVYLDTFASGSPLGFPGDPLYVLSLGTPTPTATPVPRVDTIGVYKDGVWSLRNSNTDGGPDITAVYGGDASDLPVTGDWNGNGVDTIGVYRGNSGFFYLSDSNTSPTTSYAVLLGNPGDVPFAGKWLANATHDGIGVYRDSNGILYQKNDLTSGFSDYFAVFGNPGDKVIAGDWNGDGRDSIGVSREADGK